MSKNKGVTKKKSPRWCISCAASTRASGPGRGFGTPEALALYRLNALGAGVKGALEQGL